MNLNFGSCKNDSAETQLIVIESIKEFENLSDVAQLKIKDFLYENIYHQLIQLPLTENESEPFKSNELVEMFAMPFEDVINLLSRNDIVSIIKSSGYSVPTKITKGKIAEWITLNAPDTIDSLPKYMWLKFNPKYKHIHSRLYTYLLRKFRWDSYINVDGKEAYYPHGSRMHDDGKYYFPTDYITEQLTIYGCNRCINGFVETTNNPKE